MASAREFDHERRRRIYEYVEQNGAVEPESARKNVLIQPETASKPARSGAGLEPSVKMSKEEFNHHISILKRDGYLQEEGGRLRVALPLDEDAETVEIDGLEATVRPARQEDITGIIGVIETIASVDSYVVAERLAEEIADDEVLLRQNDSEERVFFVATVDDDAVGWIHVGGENLPKMGHTATLTVGVLERYRGNGLGSKLVERGLEWAERHGYEKVYQNLPATNESGIAFLESQGWTVESARTDHYRFGDDRVDEVQLAIWVQE
jgi:GNAT superfamily N-acetyltransferase/biotin operon repressor